MVIQEPCVCHGCSSLPPIPFVTPPPPSRRYLLHCHCLHGTFGEEGVQYCLEPLILSPYPSFTSFFALNSTHIASAHLHSINFASSSLALTPPLLLTSLTPQGPLPQVTRLASCRGKAYLLTASPPLAVHQVADVPLQLLHSTSSSRIHCDLGVLLFYFFSQGFYNSEAIKRPSGFFEVPLRS